MLMPADPGPLCAGVELHLSAALGGPAGDRWPFVWTSSDPSVATIAAVRNWNGEVLPGQAVVTAAAAGEAVVTASAGTKAATVGISVRPAPCRLLAVAGDSQIGAVMTALPESLAVRLVDGRGDPMSRTIVRWGSANGTVKPDSSVTDAVGEARAQWTLNDVLGPRTAGALAIVAANGYVMELARWAFTATGVAEPPLALRFAVQPTDAEAGAVIAPVEVGATDQWGNPDPSFGGVVTISIGNNPGGGVLRGSTTVSAENGGAPFAGLSIDKPGTGYTLTAVTNGLSSSVSSWFTVSPAGAVVDQQEPDLFVTSWYQHAWVHMEAKVAQVVTAGMTGVLGQVDLAVGCEANDLVLEIQRVAGGLPTGDVLTSQIIPGEFLPEPVAFRHLVLTAPVRFSAGDRFAIVVRVRYMNPSLYSGCQVGGGPGGDPYPAGEGLYLAPPSGWTPAFATGEDFAFRTLVVR